MEAHPLLPDAELLEATPRLVVRSHGAAIAFGGVSLALAAPCAWLISTGRLLDGAEIAVYPAFASLFAGFGAVASVRRSAQSARLLREGTAVPVSVEVVSTPTQVDEDGGAAAWALLGLLALLLPPRTRPAKVLVRIRWSEPAVGGHPAAPKFKTVSSKEALALAGRRVARHETFVASRLVGPDGAAGWYRLLEGARLVCVSRHPPDARA